MPETYYTIGEHTVMGLCVRFIAPPEYSIDRMYGDFQDPGEASQEFLLTHPDAQYLDESAFISKVAEIEQQIRDKKKKEDEEDRAFWKKHLNIPDEPDFIDQYVLIFNAVDVLHKEPDIDPTWFAQKTGLYKTTHAGMCGWYMQVARDIIKRMGKEK